ncbi:MAG: DNA-binding protein [Isosphaera sp.]|nr:DNA-binding protein [Isosphaera sp.]
MSTVTFQVEDEKAVRLADAARERGVAVEALLRQITDDFLARQQGFEAAAGYVLAKNAELYRRLAR